MQLKIYKDYQALSLHVAEEIIGLIKKKPDAVLCLASGHTPLLAYNLMAQKAIDEKIDLVNQHTNNAFRKLISILVSYRIDFLQNSSINKKLDLIIQHINN